MGKRGNFAGWFLPNLQKAKNGRDETGTAPLGSVDCGETGQERAGEKSAASK